MATASTRAPFTNDHRESPAYPLAEAARYLRIPAATLRTWVSGRDYQTTRGPQKWAPLIRPAGKDPAVLSFWNLIEAHVLWGLRTSHSVSVKAVRQALTFAENELGIERLLLSRQLVASAGKIFLERYGELIQLDRAGQFAMEQIFRGHLARVEWDEWQFPVRLLPLTPFGGNPSVAIDPNIAFGRPIIRSRGIRTEVLAERLDAGESLEAVAADYDLTIDEVTTAIVYERGAA